MQPGQLPTSQTSFPGHAGCLSSQGQRKGCKFIEDMAHVWRPYTMGGELSLRKDCLDDMQEQCHGKTPGDSKGSIGFTSVTDFYCNHYLRSDQMAESVQLSS
jgi:hypothetical protein